MTHIRQDLSPCEAIASEPIRDDLAGLVPQAGQQVFEKAFCGCGIASLLHEDVEHGTMLVHRAPEIDELTVDLQINLIMCLVSPGRGRCLRSLAATSVPKRRHQRRILW